AGGADHECGQVLEAVVFRAREAHVDRDLDVVAVEIPHRRSAQRHADELRHFLRAEAIGRGALAVHTHRQFGIGIAGIHARIAKRRVAVEHRHDVGGQFLQHLGRIADEAEAQALAFAAHAAGPWPGGMGSEGEGLRFSLVGDSTQVLEELAADIVPMLDRLPALRDARVDTGDANTELSVRVDRERAAAYGFSAQEVAQFVGMALRGSSLRDFHRDDVEIPVNVRFAGSENYGFEDLATFMVRAPGGTEVPLLAMVDVTLNPASTSIQRMNRQTMLRIEAGLAQDVSMEDARKAIETALDGMQFPPGYGYTFAGMGFNINFDGMQQMVQAMVIALVLMLVIMAAVFESLLFPTAIMSCVLFSIFGVYWLFWITGTEMNIMAVIGILVLMGVVVNNGIVMIGHVNKLRGRGMTRTDALVELSLEWLRRIIMTMGAAIVAMVPIALNTDTAKCMPTYNPMARAISGGLAL